MSQTDDFFRSRLDPMIDLSHPLCALAPRVPWQEIEVSLAHRLAKLARADRIAERHGSVWQYARDSTKFKLPSENTANQPRTLSGRSRKCILRDDEVDAEMKVVYIYKKLPATMQMVISKALKTNTSTKPDFKAIAFTLK